MKRKNLALAKLSLKKVTIVSLQEGTMDLVKGGSATCGPIPSTDAVTVCESGCPSVGNYCKHTVANRQTNCCAQLSMANPPASVCNPCIPEHTQPLLCA